jgi:2,4-dienoyl-CoA reductase (NADPH2)
MAKKLAKVLEPGQIGSICTKNRLLRMGANPWQGPDNADRTIADVLVDYYEDIAAGGAGLVVIAGGHIQLTTNENMGGFRTDTDEYIPSMKRVADVIHKYDCPVLLQIMTPYPTFKPAPEGADSIASSALSAEELEGLVPFYMPTREMTKDEIALLVKRYAEQAVRLKKADFDGVEINSGHVHLHNTFLSPAWNRRTDEYGGDAENRTRLLREIITAIRAEVGKDFVIVNLISGAEYNLKNGITVADAIEHARWLERAGSDGIHVRMEAYHDAIEGIAVRGAREVPDVELYPALIDKDLSAYGIDTSFGKGIAAWSLSASEIKKKINIPVICSGRLDAYVGEQLVAAGKLDFINICRRHIADPDYAGKLIAGRDDDVRPCTGCYTCYETTEHGVSSWCMVNPTILKGHDYASINPAAKKKRVLIIGSGAAGLEAARVAALRGHVVTVVEKDSALGGTLPLAGLIKDFQEDFVGFSRWQVRQVEKLGVSVKLKTLADASFVKDFAPDVVVIAVGGAENLPDLPGIDNGIVITGDVLHKHLRKATKFFSASMLGKLSKLFLPLGKEVIVMGGAIHGVQTARFLTARGRHVTIVEESDEIGSGLYGTGCKPRILEWLFDQGTKFIKSVKYLRITDVGLMVVEPDGTKRLIEADNIVTALPMLPNAALFEQIKALGTVPEICAIGDCNPLVFKEEYPPLMLTSRDPVATKSVWPGHTVTAIREAYRIMRKV